MYIALLNCLLMMLDGQMEPNLPHHISSGHGTHSTKPLRFSSSNCRTSTPASVRTFDGLPLRHHEFILCTGVKGEGDGRGGLGGSGGGRGGRGCVKSQYAQYWHAQYWQWLLRKSGLQNEAQERALSPVSNGLHGVGCRLATAPTLSFAGADSLPLAGICLFTPVDVMGAGEGGAKD